MAEKEFYVDGPVAYWKVVNRKNEDGKKVNAVDLNEVVRVVKNRFGDWVEA